MISFFNDDIKTFLAFLPFLFLVWLNGRANLKRNLRSRQMLMPLLAMAYCVLLAVNITWIRSLLAALIRRIPQLLAELSVWLSGVLDGRLAGAAAWVGQLGLRVNEILAGLNLDYWMLVIVNTAGMAAYVVFKRIATAVLSRVCQPGSAVHDLLSGLFYTCREGQRDWYLKPHFGQARTYLKVFYGAVTAVSTTAALISAALCRWNLLEAPYDPMYAVIIVGELYFCLNGLTESELRDQIYGEADAAKSVYNLAVLRKYLRKLFGDKVTAENTTISSDLMYAATNDELLGEMERSADPRVEAYGVYMRARLNAGFPLDQNYLHSGLDLLQGRSILFNNPFYYDLIPYAFYAMDRTLLRHKKVLIILGRHGTEEDITDWCREGLRAVSNVPDLWRVGELTDAEQDLDVGIVTRSNVHNLALHAVNRPFFRQVEFVVLIEPSRLITTAQVGLNSLIHECTAPGKTVTYCSTDKNCDGLVDALSHVLMISISEVSATNRHSGTCSYMCWGADTEHLQHRMLPNLSRYLGVGTELSFAALKNQLSETRWYGGDAFPVTDMHWIVKQYYYDLLRYAGLPTNQETIDRAFLTSPNLYNERKRKVSYLTIEDEACNMFEVKRTFSTRSDEQSFINVISPAYLLRDYMAANDGVFDADAKAIPSIVADYARTGRNVTLRLCLRMSTGELKRDELVRELSLVAVGAGERELSAMTTEELVDLLWDRICACFQPVGAAPEVQNGAVVLRRAADGREFTFEKSAISMKRRYSIANGRMEELYSIADLHFQRVLLDDLQNASYIAEEEDGPGSYLGSELRGHIFQRYLPGQFFVFSGKYYEMLSVTADGRVLVRRAADHITGRPGYRQVRSYIMRSAVTAEAMGACRTVGAMRVTRQYADFSVSTPAYWQMPVYNDFAHARKVLMSGIPQRKYCNKQLLRVDFPDLGDSFTDEVRYTVTLLLNEVFRTLFAENHPYIAAVTSGEPGVPLTYGLAGADGFVPEKDAIYIIEDSQLDIGLLVAVERNLNRIFSILCDYLDWHLEAVYASENPPPPPEKPDYELAEPEVKECWLKRLIRKIKAFFKKLFHRKPKSKPQDAPAVEVPDSPVEIPAGGTPTEEVTPPEETSPEETSPEETSPEEMPVADESPAATESEPVETGVSGTGEAPTAEVEGAASAQTEPEGEAEKDGADPVLLSSVQRFLFTTQAPGQAQSEEMFDASPDTGESAVEFESDQAERRHPPMTRLPYHLRYYLLYGGESLPAGVNPSAALDFLRGLGYGDNSLKQARQGTHTAERIEKNAADGDGEGHYCDFCGIELVGTEYDVLSDGRERCPNCSRTAVRTAEEFERIFRKAVDDLDAFFGAGIHVPIKVSMVNAKRLHKKLGKSFVPTGKPDARVLGVAIRDKHDGYTILVENGSPRLASTMTIVHELTHIWQYENWNAKEIRRRYGSAQELEIYEGMAKWTEIQYAYLIGESAAAKREETVTRMRADEYGRGFVKYASRYPLSTEVYLTGETPFNDVSKPL